VTTFLSFTIVGIVLGCIYALTSTGLVVTYITSGVFNFAHAAIGMVAAFTYWELTVKDGWPVPLALPLVLFVMAPLLGVLIERLLMRNLHGKPEVTRLVITLGLMLFLLGLAETRWDPGFPRTLPRFFAGHEVKLFGVFITYHQIVVVVIAVAVALGLRLFLFRTRSGIALRAVVDDPALAALNGAAPARVRSTGWAIGAMLASLAGILLAPLVTLDILLLTLLVINGFAAAIVGRLRSLPLTFGGGLLLGLFESYAVGYVPGSVLSQIQPTLPMIFLFIVLLVLPQDRLRVGRAAGRHTTRVPTLRTTVMAAGGFVVAAWIVSGQLSVTNLITGGEGLVIALVLLSLLVLTGYGGQTSAAQLTFVGFGAFAMGKLGHGGSLLGVLAAVALAAAVGALVALPALRLRGLYLALATVAFAQAMVTVFFENNHVFGQGGALPVARVHLPGISLQSDRAFFVACAVVFAGAAVGVLALRRASFGRRLAAMSDSAAAAATLGMNITWMKLAVFTVSAGLAGLAGVLYGGLRGSVGSNDFQMLGSLSLLLLLAIWGLDSVTGVVLAGITFALFPVIQSHVPSIHSLQYLAVGLGALGLARNPDGVMSQLAPAGEGLRRWWATRRTGEPIPRTASELEPEVSESSNEETLAGVAG
jgi:branched-chain amino acid transport system permease protein